MLTADPAAAPPRRGAAAAKRAASPYRLGLVYLALVVAPVAAALALLWRGGGAGAGRSASGHPAYDPFAGLLVAVPVILAACHLAGMAFRRMSQPAVMGQVLAGILLGPSALGIAWPQAFRWLFPARLAPMLSILAQFGLIFFMFLVGFELNLLLVRKRGRIALMVSNAGISLPLLCGVGLAFGAYHALAPAHESRTVFALFLATAMSITAFPVLACVLTDRGLTRTRFGTTALTCAAIDDITAWCLLSLVLALVHGGSPAGAVVTTGLAAGFFAGMVTIARPLLARLLAPGPGEQHPLPDAAVLPVILAGVMLSALITSAIGIHTIFGAFMFGVIMPRGSARIEQAAGQLQGITSTLLLPLFFAYTGLRTQVGLLGDHFELWGWCALILLAAVTGKLAGGTAAARAGGLGWQESASLGVLMNCRGLTSLIVLNIGLSLSLITSAMFTMLVVMALVTTLLTGPGLSLARRLAPASAEAEPARSAASPEPSGADGPANR